MTLADIARLAGVSRTTASYVINGQAEQRRISSATIDKVMAVVRQHRYHIDPQAAALRRGASRLIGLIVPDLENISYARLAKRLARGARERGQGGQESHRVGRPKRRSARSATTEMEIRFGCDRANNNESTYSW